jgi:iron complex transport system substrate-binding protein
MFRAVLSLFLLALAGCTGNTPSRDVPDGWVRVDLQHARHFTLDASGPLRRLTIFGPGGERDTLGIHVIDLEGEAMDRLVVASTTHLSYLHALGRLDVVVGAAHLDRLVDTALVQALEQVPDIGHTAGLDREQLMALGPKAVLDHPFGRRDTDLRITGMEQIGITEYLEEHPLGRAEWIKFFGVLLGMEQASDSLYDRIADRYEQARSSGTDRRPTIFFGSAWQGQWFAPPGNSYMARLIMDAGGSYIFADRNGSGNIMLDLESVIEHVNRADHFGVLLAADHPVGIDDLSGGDHRLASIPSLREGGFHGNSATGDLFGRALLEPDVVLRDLRCIFHPATCAGHVPAYFRPLAQ